MGKLLYIKASPRGERSYSQAVTDAFVESYRAAHLGDEVVTIDLFKMDLPPFDGDILNAKYAILNGLAHSDAERAAWRRIEAVIDEFKSAAKYVFAVPMWNFSLPYKLKHYIDVIVQPSYTFSFTPEEGYRGLVTGKPVFVAYSRGGEYPLGSDAEAADYQSKYLEHELRFLGFSNIKKVVVEPTLASGPDAAKEKLALAIQQAQDIAKRF